MGKPRTRRQNSFKSGGETPKTSEARSSNKRINYFFFILMLLAIIALIVLYYLTPFVKEVVTSWYGILGGTAGLTAIIALLTRKFDSMDDAMSSPYVRRFVLVMSVIIILPTGYRVWIVCCSLDPPPPPKAESGTIIVTIAEPRGRIANIELFDSTNSSIKKSNVDLASFAAKPGTHRIEASANGYQTESKTLKVLPPDTARWLDVTLKKLAPPPPPKPSTHKFDVTTETGKVLGNVVEFYNMDNHQFITNSPKLPKHGYDGKKHVLSFMPGSLDNVEVHYENWGSYFIGEIHISSNSKIDPLKLKKVAPCHLKIDCDGNCEVRVDGKVISRREGNENLYDIFPGTRRVEANRNGTASLKRIVTIKPGETQSVK